jgi:putative Holliday junction resolvase
MRRGRRIAFDIGTTRIGVALSDSEGILASPIEAVNRAGNIDDTIAQIVLLAESNEAIAIYIGEPISLSGSETSSTRDARAVAEAVSNATSIPVIKIDERFTTVSAAAKLKSAGLSNKAARSVIDSASAIEILETALTAERASGISPGVSVGDQSGT